jgi:putative phosphoesterase
VTVPYGFGEVSDDKGDKVLRIGIISDTHGRLPSQIHEIFEGVDHILHAGDIGGQFLIAELNAIAPVTAVCGNCDRPDDYDFDYWTQMIFDGTNIFMTHDPRDLSVALGSSFHSARAVPHIAIHGHTHVPRQQQIGKTLWLCPGSPSRPRNGSAPSVMLLETQNGIPTKVQVMVLGRNSP